MAATVEMAPGPKPLFTDEEFERMTAFDKIVKLSEAITSGRHPRIKVPAHLDPSNRRTGSVLTEQRNDTAEPRHAATTSLLTKGNGADGTFAGVNAKSQGDNGQLPADTTARRPACAPEELPSMTGPTGIPDDRSLTRSPMSARRAKIEYQLREQVDQAAKSRHDDIAMGLSIGDILQQALELEQTFTPPPEARSKGDGADTGRTATATLTKVPSSAIADSADDDTFYSSKFNTPEFGLTSRIPVESDNDNELMRDSSAEYEPELDEMSLPTLPVASLDLSERAHLHLQMGQPPLPLPPASQDTVPPLPNQPSVDAIASIVAQTLRAQAPTRHLPEHLPAYQDSAVPPDSGNPISWSVISSGHSHGSSHVPRQAGLSGGPLPMEQGHNGPHESSYRGHIATGRPVPPSPFVRINNLSPVAPQPEHVSSLAVVSQLPLDVEERPRPYQAAPAQVAMLRRGDVSQSSPDSSPHATGRLSDKKRGKRKSNGKRKSDLAPTSPRIKAEPKSPSPIQALPVPRPHKRQRHGNREAQEAVYRYGDEYSPTAHNSHTDVRGVPTATSHGKERVPVVYERIEVGESYARSRDATGAWPANLQRPGEQQKEYDIYASAPTSFAPQRVQSDWPTADGRPSPTYYVRPASQASLRPVPAASRALADGSPGYPMQAVQGAHAVYGAGHRYSRRPSAQPEVYDRNRPQSPVMAPPPIPGRIIVDEFNREYLGPARPEPRQRTMAEAVPYEAGVAYERPLSRPAYPPAQQAYTPSFGKDEAVYRRMSPSFAAPRRVVTQPEYVSREYAGYPQREFSTRPAQYAVAPRPEQRVVLDEAPPDQDYLVRASTARPPEAARYEMPPTVHYVERVGSDQLPESAVPAGHGFVAPGNASRPYDGRFRGGLPHMHEGGGMDSHHGHEVIREYGVRPEPVTVRRAFSVRPGPGSGPPFYAEQPPYAGGPSTQEYGLPDGSMSREVYR